MSFKAAGTILTRTLWTRGSRTPPVARSSRVNGLSSTCSGSEQQGREKTEAQSWSSDGPNGDGASASEPPHRCPSREKKRPKEPAGAPGVTGVRRRSFTSTAAPADLRSYFWTRYNDTKRLVHGKQRGPLLSPQSPLVWQTELLFPDVTSEMFIRQRRHFVHLGIVFILFPSSHVGHINAAGSSVRWFYRLNCEDVTCCVKQTISQ